MRQWFWRLLVAGVLLCAAVYAMFLQASAMPIVRTGTVYLPFPADGPQKPIRVALITDTHMGGPDNSPERLSRIYDLVNAQKPDLVLLDGDYISRGKPLGRIYRNEDSIFPFVRLSAPMGVVAVLGNHDTSDVTHETNPKTAQAFADLGITLLQNEAVRRGPLAIGGITDMRNGAPDVPATLAAMRRLGGAPVLLSHNADAMLKLKGYQGLVLAGHSHCGQIALPFYGAVFVPAETGTRYACGRYDEDGKVLIVSGGVGTSGLPLRAFAPPDVWIVTIRPVN